MWKFIKKLINKFIFTKEQEILQKRIDYSKMNLGDLKKLKAEGNSLSFKILYLTPLGTSFFAISSIVSPQFSAAHIRDKQSNSVLW